MKNTKIFPFQRNAYYYGKLLSVDDFNLEQRYNCNKHRMNHMFLSGVGIVAGLYVVNVGEQNISVESGCAIDSFGREIVVDVPVMKKLQMFDGFEQATQRGENYIYLCAEYAEKSTDAVLNIAGNTNGTAGSDCMYNKVAESYHLFLTNREPNLNAIQENGLFTDQQQIYLKNGISIRQSIPRYVEVGKKAVVTVDIETTEKTFVAFSYTMNLNGLTYEKNKTLHVQFDELLEEKLGNYQLTFELDPVSTPNYSATATIEPDSFKLFLDQQEMKVDVAQRFTTSIISGDVKEHMINDYYAISMDNMLEQAHQKDIYLAKIYLTKAEDTYVIDKVVNAPFNQYVMNQSLLGVINKQMMKDIRTLEEQVKCLQGGQTAGSTGVVKQAKDIEIASGVYEIDLGMSGENKSKFYSEPIIHGLGLGYVTIILSQQTRSNEVVFGNAEIFEENDVDVDLAAQLDETSGTFVIGARLNEIVAKKSLRIQWTAIKKQMEQEEEILERRIRIKPSMLELYARDSAYLEVGFDNMDEHKITWKVQEGGGTVDETNVYTAPNEKGVYEIVVQSVAYPDVKASVYAVVRERN